MVNFSKLLTPEARARNAARRAAFEKQKCEVADLTDEQLIHKMQLYMNNAGDLHNLMYKWRAGDPVYDGIILHVLIPEMMSRLVKPTPGVPTP